MLTRCLRIIAIAALAFAQPAFAHHVSGTATAVATSVVLTGTARQLTVEDRTTGKTTTYQTLRLDDGTAVELDRCPCRLAGDRRASAGDRPPDRQPGRRSARLSPLRASGEEGNGGAARRFKGF